MAWLKSDYKEAKAIYMDIQTHLGLLGEKNMRSSIIGILGSLALDEGDLGQARLFLEESLKTAQELQNHYFSMLRLMALGNLSYLEGNVEEFKRRYREGLSLAQKLTITEKLDCLLITLRTAVSRPNRDRVFILGCLHHWQQKTDLPFDPILKRFYDRAEPYALHALGDEMFEAIFAEGQKLSPDEALALVLRTIEEM